MLVALSTAKEREDAQLTPLGWWKMSAQHREDTALLPSRRNMPVAPTFLPLMHTSICVVLSPVLGTYHGTMMYKEFS